MIGLMTPNLHSYDIDGEMYEYALEDVEIEYLVRSRSINIDKINVLCVIL
jgi:hypothetical protein